jgi:hypothetical protein
LGCTYVEWIQLAHYSVPWQLRVNTALMLEIKNLIRPAIIKSSRRIRLSEVGYLLIRQKFDGYCQWCSILLVIKIDVADSYTDNIFNTEWNERKREKIDKEYVLKNELRNNQCINKRFLKCFTDLPIDVSTTAFRVQCLDYVLWTV